MNSFLAYGSLQQLHIESVHVEVDRIVDKLNTTAAPSNQI